MYNSIFESSQFVLALFILFVVCLAFISRKRE